MRNGVDIAKDLGLYVDSVSDLGRFIYPSFSDHEFAASTPISNIKYNHPVFQNNNLFDLFHDQLDYRLAKYFAKFEIPKNNVDKFLFEPLIASLIEKLSY